MWKNKKVKKGYVYLEEKEHILDNYKSYEDKNTILLRVVLYKRFLQYAIPYIGNIFCFSFIIFTSGKNIDDLVLWIYISMTLYLLANASMAAGCYMCMNTFRHAYVSTTAIFSAITYIMMYLYPSIYLSRIYNINNYLYAVFFIFMLPITVYFIIFAHRVIKKNFSVLYYIINDKIFFDHLEYKSIEVTQLCPPGLYWRFLLLLLGLAAGEGLYGHSFHFSTGSAISIGICTLGFIFLLYPNFVYAAYMLLFVHPRVAKTFKQPVLSDQWGFFELDAALAEKFFGPNPVKRPIRYEEVFPQKKSD